MSGYILFDCGGLNLNSSSKQTITGIYNRAKEALATGHTLRIVIGSDNGATVTNLVAG